MKPFEGKHETLRVCEESGKDRGATASVHMFHHIDGVVSVTLIQINLP
jgi:hypothetical protein